MKPSKETIRLAGLYINHGDRSPEATKANSEYCQWKRDNKQGVMLRKEYSAWRDNEQIGCIYIMSNGRVIIDTNYGFNVTEDEVLQAEWIEQ